MRKLTQEAGTILKIFAGLNFTVYWEIKNIRQTSPRKGENTRSNPRPIPHNAPSEDTQVNRHRSTAWNGLRREEAGNRRAAIRIVRFDSVLNVL